MASSYVAEASVVACGPARDELGFTYYEILSKILDGIQNHGLQKQSCVVTWPHSLEAWIKYRNPTTGQRISLDMEEHNYWVDGYPHVGDGYQEVEDRSPTLQERNDNMEACFAMLENVCQALDTIHNLEI